MKRATCLQLFYFLGAAWACTCFVWFATSERCRTHASASTSTIGVRNANSGLRQVWVAPRDAYREVRYTSQCGQDEFVASVTRGAKKGFYLDVGAHDAEDLSNTYYLDVALSWNGVCVEAQPKFIKSLTGRSCHILNTVVGGENRSQVEFVDHGSGLSGILGSSIGSNTDNMVSTKSTTREYSVGLITVLQMLDVPNRIDYFTLDVEGAEDYVLAPRLFDAYVFRVIEIERPTERVHELLRKNGYEFVMSCGYFGSTMYFNVADDELWRHVPRTRKHLFTAEYWRLVEKIWIQSRKYLMRTEHPGHASDCNVTLNLANNNYCAEIMRAWMTAC
eukprot:gene7893-9374_t